MQSIELNVVKGLRLKALATTLLTMGFAIPVMADDQYQDRARVLSVSPQTERVNMPRQECRTEYQQQNSRQDGERSISGAVIGGVAGGLLGNTIGRGNGRIAAAAIGAGVGALAGDRIANQNNNSVTRRVPVQSCYQIDHWQTVNSSYLVTYEYHGRTYSTVTNEHPGSMIDVNVAISPSTRSFSQITYNEPAWQNQYRHQNKHRGWNKSRDHDREHQDRYYY